MADFQKPTIVNYARVEIKKFASICFHIAQDDPQNLKLTELKLKRWKILKSKQRSFWL